MADIGIGGSLLFEGGAVFFGGGAVHFALIFSFFNPNSPVLKGAITYYICGYLISVILSACVTIYIHV